MMRKIIFTLLLFCSVTSFAQKFKIGAKAGMNISSLIGNYPKEIEGQKMKSGYHIGGLLEYKLNNKLSLQQELLVSTQGVLIEGKKIPGAMTFSKQDILLTYLNSPILLKYKVVKKLNVEFGIQFGYLLSAQNEIEINDPFNSGNNQRISLDGINGGTHYISGIPIRFEGRLNRFDFGFNLGTSYHFSERFFIQGRYNLGVIAVDKNSGPMDSNNSWKLKNSVFQFSIGYLFK